MQAVKNVQSGALHKNDTLYLKNSMLEIENWIRDRDWYRNPRSEPREPILDFKKKK